MSETANCACARASTMAPVVRVGLVTVASGIAMEDNVVSLFQLGAKPQRECEVVPTRGPGEGPVGTNECQEDFNFTSCCKSCEQSAVFWKR